MTTTSATEKRLFVLDTNVLMHDPTALFRFEEHDIYLPMLVLEELDAGKKGLSETARNARQSSRFIDDLLTAHADVPIDQGLPLSDVPLHGANGNGNGNGHALEKESWGRLFFETQSHTNTLPSNLPGNRPDNSILSTALSLMHERPEYQVTLVSKDINLRIKANVVGVHAEDYYNDKVLEDARLLYSGVRALPADFWDTHGKQMESWQEEGRTYYRLSGPNTEDWHANECLYLDGEQPFDALVREPGENPVIEHARQFYSDKQSVWGIRALNREQNFALNLLMDPEVEFVTLVGVAGTGKTLLTLAAGLEQTLEDRRYNEIIMTRVTVPVGEDIGFLPGTEEEKMTPWMGALMDNLEVLTKTGGGNAWERDATSDLLAQRIKVRSVNFMRGRTFLNRYLIIDEAQNLTPKQLKTLITRAGPGTKIICLGNISQIDTPYLSETTSGLTYVVDRFRGWPHAGHVILTRGERSRLADYASDVL